MKTIKIFLIALLLSGVPLIQVFGQEEPEEPEEPELLVIPEAFYQMSEEEESGLLKSLNSNLRASLEYIKQANEHKYYDLLRESQFKNMRFPYLNKRDKKRFDREQRLFELEIVSESLAAKYLKAKENERAKIKPQLRTTLNELFELREADRKFEVEMLEKELTKLTKQLKVRMENKSKIIDRRIQELLGEDDYLDWD